MGEVDALGIGYNRVRENWIDYPEGKKEQDIRAGLFPEGVMKHPAKANLFMIYDLIKYQSEEGDVLLDPFGGTGTILVAGRMGRHVILTEIEEGYHELQKEAAKKLGVEDMVTLLHGNCRLLLPIPCNHIITSPPYAAIMKKGKKESWGGDITGSLYDVTEEEFQRYSCTKGNVGQENKFMYNQVMEQVYKKCYDSLVEGGTMSIILKDYISDGKRVYLSDWLIRACLRLGFQVKLWEKRLAGGSPFVKIRRARGEPTVDDEDIVIFEKV